MSKFFDELVNARREGTAPGQGEDNAGKPGQSHLVTFSPIPEGVPLHSCDLCGAAMPPWKTPDHAGWHAGI